MSITKMVTKFAIAIVGLTTITTTKAAITITDSARTNGRLSSLTLAFPSAESASSIWVASGPKDEGTTLGNWQSLNFGAEIAVGDTSCTVPVQLKGGETALRLIMLSNTDAYTELESISATDGAYITTGFTPNGMARIRCDFKLDEVKDSAIFGARVAPYNNSFCMLTLVNNGFRYDYGKNIMNSSYKPTKGNRYVAEMDYRSLRLDGNALSNCTRSDGAETVSPGCPVILFAMNNNKEMSSSANATIYSFKAWSNTDNLSGTLVSDLVPCKKKDGTVGMINRETGGFQTNSGTLTAGEAKDHSTLGGYVDSSVAIDACALTRTMTVDKSYLRSKKACADLSFSTGFADSMVIAAYGQVDAGEKLADWPNSVVLDVVPALTEQMTVTIPATIDENMKVIRYFLVPRCASTTYDRPFSGVRATGKQYIITDFTPTQSALVFADFMFDTISETQVPFSARTMAYTEAFSVLHTASQGFRLDYRGYVGNSLKKASIGQTYRITASSYLNIDNERILTVPDNEKKDFTAGSPLTIFALNSAGIINNFAKAVCSRFYAWKVNGDDSTRVLDLIPCEKNGEVGFYNKIDGKFYGNMGEGAFEAVGPESVNTNAHISAVSSAIATPKQVGLSVMFQ